MSKKESLITKITIQIAGKEVDVTPDELRSLYQAVGELLGAEKVRIVERDRYYPYWPYPTTTWVYSPTTIGGSTALGSTWTASYTSNADGQTGAVNLLVQ